MQRRTRLYQPIQSYLLARTYGVSGSVTLVIHAVQITYSIMFYISDTPCFRLIFGFLSVTSKLHRESRHTRSQGAQILGILKHLC